MKKKVYKAFNEQVQAELYSAYMYLAMSLDMEAKNFKGMANWLKAQYEEERGHAFKLMAFMQDCGEKPELTAAKSRNCCRWKLPLRITAPRWNCLKKCWRTKNMLPAAFMLCMNWRWMKRITLHRAI